MRVRAIDYLNTREELYCVDAFAGWDPDYRLKVRVICARPYHALFMHNMLIRPTAEELADFGEPDYTIYNAGQQAAVREQKFAVREAAVGCQVQRQPRAQRLARCEFEIGGRCGVHGGRDGGGLSLKHSRSTAAQARALCIARRQIADASQSCLPSPRFPTDRCTARPADPFQ